MLEEC
jgi:hypothetical protein